MANKTRVQLPGTFNKPSTKFELQIDIAVLGFTYNGDLMDGYTVLKQIERDIEGLLTEKSRGIVTTQKGRCSFRDCELYPIHPDEDPDDRDLR